MLSNILLPVDLEHRESWIKAINVAADLAERDRAILHFVYVVPMIERNLNRLPKDHEPELKEFAERNAPSSVRWEAHVVAADSPHRGIRNVAKDVGADLIVMAAHNPRLSDYFFGSNAAHVALHSSTSVYIVR